MSYKDLVEEMETIDLNIKDFLNDDYKILRCIVENQDEDNIANISQDNIVKITEFSKGKVNSSIKNLINKGYLIKEKKGYSLTKPGEYVCIVLG